MSEIIKTDNLIVGYGAKIVIDDVSIEIASGEIITLIGPNGSGKSTLLKSIAGQLKNLGGRIYLGEQDLYSKPASEIAKEISVLFTGDSPREKMTCRDVVALGRYPYTGILGRLSEKDEEIITEAMLLTTTEELAMAEFGEISDGQRQRVLLARALCQEPEVLILDEPTTYLDIRYRLEFISLLRKLSAERGFAVLMSLHELDMAKQISDRIICVKEGKIHRVGSPDEVYTPGYISELFDISVGTYDELSCSVRL